MINISFANPYLLLLLIPLFAAVIVPFFIAVRKVNNTKETTIALICHLLIVVFVVLAVAGMANTTVITKTELYVVADVSYSSNHKLDLIDSYIAELEEKLPKNSKMGVITFGKDAKVHVKPGEELTSVKDSGVDTSATDIASALRFAIEQYTDNTIKHLVLYTDGLSTDPDANGDLVRVVQDLESENIYLSVVYIDSNLSDDSKEVQISDVEFNASTFLNRDSAANILIESSFSNNAIVRLTKDGEKYLEKTASLEKGFNVVNFDLYTSEESGEFGYDYEVSIIPLDDTSEYNNKFSFTQKVNGKMQVLHITSKPEDADYVKALYGENADVTSCIKSQEPVIYGQKPKPFKVPYTVEDLCQYDEIVISNVEISDVDNASTFVESLDMVVSVFGKSLITAGNNKIQTSEEEAVLALGNMLPIKYGNHDGDPKLYTIVIDSSRSMQFQNFDFFTMAKSAAGYLLDLLESKDYFAIYHFSGETYTLYTPTQATAENVSKAKDAIEKLEVTQGTMIGRALENVYYQIALEPYDDKQVMLISDGMSFEGGETLDDDPEGAAAMLSAENITVSTLNTGNDAAEGVKTMKNIAGVGGGKYYFARSSDELPGVMFDEVADDMTESEIVGDTPVIINRKKDDVLVGIDELPNINGYYYGKSKASSENILYVEYVKSGGNTVKVPLYAYWNYGNGRVSALSTDLGGAFVSSWQTGEGYSFLQNITVTATPDERIDHPYTVETSFDGKNTQIEIVPAVLNPDATMTVKITRPDGSTEEKLLTFDSYRYFYTFETADIGKYTIETTYDWTTKTYKSETIFNISYSPEYDSFTSYSPAAIHAFVRTSGTVTEDGNAELRFDEAELETYVVKFTVPFLAIAAALYIIDTVIRKLKWADIKSFFKRRRKETKK